MHLTARQATLLYGRLRTKPTLTWNDIVARKLTFDGLLAVGIPVRELILIQPDPVQWVQHAGVDLRHLRKMMEWPANPFDHLGADLADVLALKLSVVEMVRMEVTYGQLVRHGMDARTELMFKFAPEEWELLGK